MDCVKKLQATFPRWGITFLKYAPLIHITRHAQLKTSMGILSLEACQKHLMSHHGSLNLQKRQNSLHLLHPMNYWKVKQMSRSWEETNLSFIPNPLTTQCESPKPFS